jgi:hypothetical protein
MRAVHHWNRVALYTGTDGILNVQAGSKTD